MITDFESKLNLPTGTFLKVIKYDGQDGAWAKLERGEISWDNFSKALTQEVSNVVSREIPSTHVHVLCEECHDKAVNLSC